MPADWNPFLQTIESLHIDLKRLEYNSEEAGRDLALDAIKCVLLNRIAALEAASAILRSHTLSPTQIAKCPILIPSLSNAELEALQEAAESVPRQTLD